MNDVAANASAGLQQAWASILLFFPKLLMFVAILGIGYFVAKFLCKIVNRVLDRTGFDRLVERGGIRKALEKSAWDASDIVGKLVFYFVMLFTLQLAFGVFGPNPVSALLTGIIAYLPNILAAGLIIIVAAAIAAGARQIIQAAIGGLPYGRALAMGASVAIWMVGIFAALDQLNIAPAIVNGLFYAMLAVVAGSAIVAIGGGGIEPMRAQWTRVLDRVERETPRLKSEGVGAKTRAQGKVEEWKERAPGPSAPRPPSPAPSSSPNPAIPGKPSPRPPSASQNPPPKTPPGKGSTPPPEDSSHDEPAPHVPRFKVPPERPPGN